jgi:hypothetical protein
MRSVEMGPDPSRSGKTRVLDYTISEQLEGKKALTNQIAQLPPSANQN